MEEILSVLNTIPSPYSDLAAVGVIFLILVLLSLVIAFLFEQKPKKEAVKPEPGKEAYKETEKVLAAPDLDVFKAPHAGEAIPAVLEAPAEHLVTRQAREPEKAAPEAIETFEPQAEPEEPEAEAPAGGEEAAAAVEEPEETKEGLFARLRKGLSKTHTGLFGRDR